MSTVQSFQLYTPDEERAVVRKFDRKLVLFVALLYMLSFLDRSNIGNAKIAGLDEDLHLDSDKYEWVITAFYIAYICFEWMSVLWKIVPPHIYVTIIVLSWGITASLQSVSTSFAGLLILRTLLGIGEAGFTGIPFYLSFFFKREELALRTGFFISAAPLATSFASTLAWAIIKLGKYSPIAPWRLLFLLEGFPSVLVAVVAWHAIPDSPETASYLTKREKRVAKLRLRKEKDPNIAKSGLNAREMLAALLDPKSYLTALMFFFTNMAFSSLPVFLPTIIRSMGHSVLVSQALSAPPYLLSFLLVILTAYISDRVRTRWPFVLFHALLSASGYAFIAIAGAMGWGIWWRYAGIYPAAVGFFSVITIIITWTINNQESESSRGTGFAMLQLIGQMGPLVGTRLYPDSHAPLYISGMSTCAAAMVLVAVLALVLRFYLARLNKKALEGYGKIAEEGRTLVSDHGTGKAVPFKFML
ncbi:hypothetical protein OIDMADRAFT_200096 [Oidiodendron maius Zn]|uniref:Major facilitator superfamily (MFS) profile domain-containing protein n=1 Tax=Oidiodendron maius (strain Zn) TaxID=913774 RepID=A0A0C3HDY7_OIDMZ|nr:hypothetical protein OIDMADRAFT_200096 [Oidiodendron maius Zn]